MIPYTQTLSVLEKDLDLQAGKAALQALKTQNLPHFDPISSKERDYWKTLKQQYPFKKWVLFGTGGSSLGAKTLCDLKGASSFEFIDNLDPLTLSGFLETVECESTGFLIISKSGSTTETLVQLSLIWQKARTLLGDQAAAHFIVISDPKPSPLRTFSEAEDILCLDHPPLVGGRFSVFSIVGLFPAFLDGVDIDALQEGAQALLKETFEETTDEPLLGALSTYFFEKKGYPMHVLMPYADGLQTFSFWYRQLWAESLGKEGRGTTPINALGAVDQHSQLQLYLGGPKDKVFTLMIPDIQGKGSPIPGFFPQFDGKKVGDVLWAQCRATYQSLMNQGCPTRLLRIRDLSSYTIGSLLMHFILETLLVAALQKVNPFDQPAVEESKILTREYLQEGLSA